LFRIILNKSGLGLRLLQDYLEEFQIIFIYRTQNSPPDKEGPGWHFKNSPPYFKEGLGVVDSPP
jgi:hypothetical protein